MWGVLASWVILYVEVQASWFVLRWGVSAAARPLRGSTSAVICPLHGGASDAVRSLCGNVSGQEKTARRRKAPSLARPSRSAFLRRQVMALFRRDAFPKGRIGAATESYRAGNAITNTAPPSGALNAVTVPSKLSTISFTMASPRPAPPLLRAREASLR